MQRTIILLAACLLLNRFQSLDAELNVTPRDTEVMVNDSTYMNCSTSLEARKVHWRHGNNYVYAGTLILEPYNVRFSVETNSSTGTNNLVIRSVQPLDAGRYKCLEDEGFGVQSSAQLIVLDAISSKVTTDMTMNDEVTCFANTSQICTYKWKWYRGHDWIIVSNGQILKPNKVGLHRCEATCSINNKSCTVESMFAEVYSTTATSERNLMALLVLIVLPVIALIGVVVYFRKRSQNQLMELNRKITKREEQLQRLNELEREEREQEQQRLIEALPEKYKSNPVLVQTIKRKVKTWITGFTILDKELFVVSTDSSEVEVYNSVKFSFNRRWKLKELIDPTDIGSCNINKCLYIFDYKHVGESKEILRVDPNGKLISKWSTGVECVRGMSVTDESNVILTVSRNNEGKINEYSPDGQLVREINLSHADISCPWHAIKLANGHFLVTHGDAFGGLFGVCVVDLDGYLKKSFDGNCGSTIEHLGWPTYLAIDGNGFVMVVDGDNDRVLLLDLELEFKRVLLSRKKHRFLDHLSKILLNQTTNQLLVITFLGILVFGLASEK